MTAFNPAMSSPAHLVVSSPARCHPHSRCSGVLAVLAAVACAAQAARAGQTLSWIGPNGGSWNIAANWLPPIVPGEDDVISFSGGAYVSVAGNHVVSSILVNDGQLTLDIEGVLRVSQPIDMGSDAALTILGGELHTNAVYTYSQNSFRVENGAQWYHDGVLDFKLEHGSTLTIGAGSKAEFPSVDLFPTAPAAIRVEGIDATLVIRDVLRTVAGPGSAGNGQVRISNGAHLQCDHMELVGGTDQTLEPALKLVVTDDADVTIANELRVAGFAEMMALANSTVTAGEVLVSGRLVVRRTAHVAATRNIVVSFVAGEASNGLGEIILEGGTIEAQKVILGSFLGLDQDIPTAILNPCLNWDSGFYDDLHTDSSIPLHSTLRGRGYVLGELVNHGLVRPEIDSRRPTPSPFASTDLTIEGDYWQGDLGVLQVEIGARSEDSAARLIIQGTAHLSGALDLTVQDPNAVRPENNPLVLYADEHIEGEFCRIPGAVLPEPLRDRFFAGLDYVKHGSWTPSGDELWVIILGAPTLADGSPLPGLPIGGGIALVTHGTSSTATGPGDIGEIADLMQRFNAAHFSPGQWQVLKFDWREYATGKDDIRDFLIPFHPVESARIGAAIGRSLVDWLIELDPSAYQHVEQWHLLSHSSGSWLVDAMSDRIKGKGRNHGLPPEVLQELPFDTQSQIPVHLTYFDAFALAGSPWLANLGRLADTADFSEQYVDGNCLPPMTNSTLPDVVNVDVTLLNPDWSTIPHPVTFHAWPYQWYMRTIRAALTESFEPCDVDATCAWQLWGFVLSPMYRDYARQAGLTVIDSGALVRGAPRYIVPANYTGHKDFGCHWIFHEAADLLQQAVSLAGEGWHRPEGDTAIAIEAAAGSTYAIGVPVPAVLSGPTPTPVRGIAFDYRFLTRDAAELKVTQGDTEVWKTGSDFARSMDMESSLIPLAEQDPVAIAPLRFSLASENDTNVEVVISNFRYATLEKSGDQQPSNQPEPVVPGLCGIGLCGMGTMTMLCLTLLSLGAFRVASARRACS